MSRGLVKHLFLLRNSRGPHFPASFAVKSGPYDQILATEWEQKCCTSCSGLAPKPSLLPVCPQLAHRVGPAKGSSSPLGAVGPPEENSPGPKSLLVNTDHEHTILCYTKEWIFCSYHIIWFTSPISLSSWRLHSGSLLLPTPAKTASPAHHAGASWGLHWIGCPLD